MIAQTRIVQATRDWLQRELQTVQQQTHIANHIDQLVGDGLISSDWLSAALVAFATMAEFTKNEKHVRPSLHVALEPGESFTEAIRYAFSGWDSLDAELSSMEPPTLYVTGSGVCLLLDILQIYEYPVVPPPIPSCPGRTVYARYRTWRGPMDFDNEDEFSRSIIVEAYDDDMIPKHLKGLYERVVDEKTARRLAVRLK